MKPILKENLKCAFEAPPPHRKKEFLRRIALPQMSLNEFMLSQVGYIRKWIWVVSAMVFVLSLLNTCMFSEDMLWMISASTPLLALTIVSEYSRSESYEMAELEMATRFSLRSVVIARLGILGVENLVILSLLIPIGIWKNMVNPIQMGVYILVPYLLTAFIGLYIVRKLRGREAIFLCAGATGLVSFFVFFFHHTFPQIYQAENLAWWVAVVLLLCMGTVRQTCLVINRMEELT